ncbi:MAG: hypothetical protein KDE51_22800, partial [Anaerolineales bacterium]|nr:hypothetical protein [Anaerolineales bacterium]
MGLFCCLFLRLALPFTNCKFQTPCMFGGILSSTVSTPTAVGYGTLIRQNRRFRFLWMGQIVSLLGDW